MKENIINTIKGYYQSDLFKIDPTGYFYDLSQIEENINNLKSNMPSQISLYYAIKANSNENIMNCITSLDYVKGLEIASYGELEFAKKFVDTNKVIFTGPGKTIYELEMAIKNGIRLINVESIVELYRIQEIAEKLNIANVNVLLRMNLNYSLAEGKEKMAGCSTKMGIDENYINDVFEEIKNLKRITIKGIHTFIASGVLDYKALIKSNRYIFDFVKKMESKFGNIDIIDFGGGLGIDYSNEEKIFDIVKYGDELRKLIKEYDFSSKEIIMELGTYIVGNAGYYTGKIIDIKDVKNYKHIIIAGGVNHMGLPLEMRRKHPVEIIMMYEKKYYSKQFSIKEEMADISGPLCMVSDKLCWNELIHEANIGDIVVFKQSGAYCYAEGMQEFLKHFKPKEIIIRSDGNEN